MPCTGGCSSAPEDTTAIAGLCAILRVLTEWKTLNDVLADVNWAEAGVSRPTLMAWWGTHQDQDRARKMAEQAARRRQKLAEEAWAKLTPEQREALGVRAPTRY